MAVARPTFIILWTANNPGARVTPPQTLIDSGYDPSQKPYPQHYNATIGNITDWINYFADNVKGGGGGGAAITWTESAKLSPEPKTEYDIAVYSYSPGNVGQALVALLEVPSTYNAGVPISIYNRVYSGDTTSGANLQFQTLTTLIRTGIDKVNSTTNQHISTNPAISLSTGTLWVPQPVIYDLTDANGLVNGVAVSPGDLLKIELLRGVDTSTMNASSITFASIPTFS